MRKIDVWTDTVVFDKNNLSINWEAVAVYGLLAIFWLVVSI